MLFNSFEFIFVFLPIVLGVYYAVAPLGAHAQVKTLALASLVFYCGWDIRYLPLLLASVVVNFVAGRAIARLASSPSRAYRVLVAGVVANLALLVYYKYANFFATGLNAGFGWSLPLMDIVLPLGISFFTFTQLAFLVDTYRGKSDEPDFVQYLAFVTYFPHLIAGPILHHHETIPQFRRNPRPRAYWFAPGAAMFALGLAKKVLIADPFGAMARPVFDAFAAQTPGLSGLDAWVGALAYTFQLYFDFSAYCDMAVGISLMFGIYIPLNFDSPYKATSIIDFWRRWHMTLSRYLRDYLYIALGGSRRGQVRRYVNLLLTMVLGGLWHGAGWTFLAWGALHGGYLVVNHAWRALRPTRDTRPSWIGTQAARLLTFLCVVVAWVFFRADSVATATGMLGIMAGLPGQLSPGIATAIGALLIPPAVPDAGFALSPSTAAASALAAGFVLVWGFRNTQEMVFNESPWSRPLETAPPPEGWRAHWAMVPLTGAALLCGLLGLIAAPPGEFLYFNF